jgi:hypothetical protein
MAEATKPPELSVAALKQLTTLAHTTGAKMAGFLVNRDQNAIYVSDPHGTWVIPHDAYEHLTDWDIGPGPVPMHVEGKPVRLTIREGALIHEIRPWRIRRGGDQLEAKKNRDKLRKIFSLNDDNVPTTERTALGERQLLLLEEAMGRRLGWDPNQQLSSQDFALHHFRAASWDCSSDGGGS